MLCGVARADFVYGNVISPDELEVVDDSDGRLRVRVGGGFLSWSAGGYDEGTRGSVELVCPAGRVEECRAQWTTLLGARKRGDCVAMGWDTAPLAVGAAATEWPVMRGMRVIAGDDPTCVRAHTATSKEPLEREAPPAVLPRPDDSYGRYILMVDGINLASSFLLVGVGGYFVAAPALHISRGNYGRAAISLGMRVAFPIAGAVVGGMFAERCDRNAVVCLPPEILAGFAIGVLTAMIVDAAALGGGSDPPKSGAIAPGIGVASTGASVGFAVTF
jgi:hypothetical protein